MSLPHISRFKTQSLPDDHFLQSGNQCDICQCAEVAAIDNPHNYSTSSIVKILLCGHIFHELCLSTWLETQHLAGSPGTCPTCRQVLVEGQERRRRVYGVYCRVRYDRRPYDGYVLLRLADGRDGEPEWRIVDIIHELRARPDHKMEIIDAHLSNAEVQLVELSAQPGRTVIAARNATRPEASSSPREQRLDRRMLRLRNRIRNSEFQLAMLRTEPHDAALAARLAAVQANLSFARYVFREINSQTKSTFTLVRSASPEEVLAFASEQASQQSPAAQRPVPDHRTIDPSQAHREPETED